MNLLILHLASVLVLAVTVEVACRLGRFRPAICHALWLVVLVKLIVPPVVAWPILELLKSPINIEFEAIHLQEIAQFIQDSFEMNIVLDGQVIMPEGKDWNAPPLGLPAMRPMAWSDTYT